MKRGMAKWTCAGALSMPALAPAQSSVTLTGLIDGGVTYVNNQHGGAATLSDSGVLSPHLLIFKGAQDLGGGNQALFDLTSQSSGRESRNEIPAVRRHRHGGTRRAT